MRRVLAFLIMLLTALTESAAASADDSLNQFYRKYLDDWLAQRPLSATQLGEHRYDDQLEDLSRPARERFRQLLRRTLDQLPDRVEFEALSPEAKIDYTIFEHDLKRLLWLEENTDPWAEDPRMILHKWCKVDPASRKRIFVSFSEQIKQCFLWHNFWHKKRFFQRALRLCMSTAKTGVTFGVDR